MSQDRKAIREALRELLVDTTAAGSNVFINRSTPLHQGEVPGLLVYARDEEVEVATDAPREYKRKVRIAVEAAVAEDDELVDDKLDDLLTQVELLVFADPTLDGCAAESRLLSVELDYDDTGDRNHAGGRVTFEVVYYQLAPEGKPGDLHPFEAAGIEWDLPPAEPAATLEEARDEVELEQT